MTPREEFLIDLSNIITTSVSLGSEISGLNDDEDANTDYLQKLTDDFTEKWAPKDDT